MNKFRRSKVYCAIVIAMNLAGLGEANAEATSGGIDGQLTLDGSITPGAPLITKNVGTDTWNINANTHGTLSG